MRLTRQAFLTTARFAGQVLRYHTWPVHHRQTVGEHVFQVMRIYTQIWGMMPPEVSNYILWHDCGEIVSGDAPYPVKSKNPVFKEEHDRIEKQSIEAMGGDVSNFENDPSWRLYKVRVKLCDLLDLWECGRVELNMGNKYALPIIHDVEDSIQNMLSTMNRMVEDADNVIKYMAKVRGNPCF